MQDTVDVLPIAVEAGHVTRRRVGRQPAAGNARVALAQRLETRAVTGILTLGLRDEPEQRIGDALPGPRARRPSARPAAHRESTATLWKHAASATLEPPNLCTTQEEPAIRLQSALG
jgi:hypothetical protein